MCTQELLKEDHGDMDKLLEALPDLFPMPANWRGVLADKTGKLQKEIDERSTDIANAEAANNACPRPPRDPLGTPRACLRPLMDLLAHCVRAREQADADAVRETLRAIKWDSPGLVVEVSQELWPPWVGAPGLCLEDVEALGFWAHLCLDSTVPPPQRYGDSPVDAEQALLSLFEVAALPMPGSPPPGLFCLPGIKQLVEEAGQDKGTKKEEVRLDPNPSDLRCVVDDAHPFWAHALRRVRVSQPSYRFANVDFGRRKEAEWARIDIKEPPERMPPTKRIKRGDEEPAEAEKEKPFSDCQYFMPPRCREATAPPSVPAGQCSALFAQRHDWLKTAVSRLESSEDEDPGVMVPLPRSALLRTLEGRVALYEYDKEYLPHFKRRWARSAPPNKGCESE